ncbi:hypothetical protein [Burkholderia oklahomensis]|nr:hypothetical protein [Burkholderia oklahomensis]
MHFAMRRVVDHVGLDLRHPVEQLVRHRDVEQVYAVVHDDADPISVS